MNRRTLITILDALGIVLASAAIVIWLGGRTTISVLDERLFLRTPWRPALVAVALAAVRLIIAPRVALLPALAGRTTAALDDEKSRFIVPPARPRGFWLYAVAAVAASLVWVTPHLLNPRSVPDAGDPVFSAWRLGRFAQQLAHDPRHLFDGGIYYPAADTLTYSDATVLQALVAAPFILGGADPLLVANLIFLAAFPLGALAYFYAGWRLTLDPRAALIAGMLGSLYPFHWEHYSHLELQFTCFIPLAIVGLLALLAKPTVRRGVALGVLLTLQWLACMYFGVMLAAFLAPFGIVTAIAWRVRPDVDLLKSTAAAAIVAALGFAALAWPYMTSRTARGERGMPFVAAFSATADEYTHPTGGLVSYQWISRERNRIEREMFPGLSILALAGIGALPPLGGITIASITSGSLAFDWSLGTNGLTYDEMYRWVLPLRSMRVPARFSAFVGSVLVLLAAFGAARLFRLAAKGPLASVIFAAVVAIVLFDLRPRLTLIDYWQATPSIYASVTPEMVLAEFPWHNDTDYMYFSLTHRARLLNGYSGYVPGPYLNLQNELTDFPSVTSLEALRRSGATHLTVNCRFYGAQCARVLQELDATNAVQPIASAKWEGSDVRLYKLVKSPPPAPGRSR
jgi:hypothetical protein